MVFDEEFVQPRRANGRLLLVLTLWNAALSLGASSDCTGGVCEAEEANFLQTQPLGESKKMKGTIPKVSGSSNRDQFLPNFIHKKQP